MTWRDTILAWAAERNARVFSHELGLGVDFPDGNDAFWILPGEFLSTLELPDSGPSSIADLISTYDSLAQARQKALHAIRHHLARSGAVVVERDTGEWSLQIGAGTTTLAVGGYLTRTLLHADVEAGVLACLGMHWLEAPTSLQIQQYLETSDPPPPVAQPARPALTADRAVPLMTLIEVANDRDQARSGPELLERLARPRPFKSLMIRLGELLPNVEVALDLLEPGTVSFAFEDGYGDSFVVPVQQAEYTRRLEIEGIESVATSIASDYERLRFGRKRVLGAIHQVAHDRRWHMQFDLEVVEMGARHVEARFEPSRLTTLLQEGDEKTTIAGLFADQPEICLACIVALENPTTDPGRPPEGTFLPSGEPKPLELVSLTQVAISTFDSFAASVIERVRGSLLCHEYLDPMLYEAATDTWISTMDWLGIAERSISKFGVSAAAVLILLDAGSPLAAERMDEYARMRGIYDGTKEDVLLIWRCRRRYPELARNWFGPKQNEDIPHLESRVEDPVAARFRQLTRTPHDHESLLRWAREESEENPVDPEKLQQALAEGWVDVAEAIWDNRYRLATFGTLDGALRSARGLLVWSRLSPSIRLAQLVATIHQMPMREQIAKAESGLRPVYELWLEELERAMAIVWTRCRDALHAWPTDNGA